MARIPGALGPEGAGDQQRSHWTGHQAAMVCPDRVGRRTSRHERRATGWADVRSQRRELLLWRRDRGRNGLELVADPPGAVRGSSAARRGGAAGCDADDDVAPTGSAPPPAAKARRPDLQSDDACLRSEPPDVHRGRSNLRADLSRRRRDPVGRLPSLERRSARGARRPPRRGHGISRGPDRRHRRTVCVGDHDRCGCRHPRRDRRGPAHHGRPGIRAGVTTTTAAAARDVDRARHGDPAHDHDHRNPAGDPSLRPLVSVCPGMRARRPSGGGVASSQLRTGARAVVADLRIHGAGGRPGRAVGPVVRGGAADPDRPLRSTSSISRRRLSTR